MSSELVAVQQQLDFYKQKYINAEQQVELIRKDLQLIKAKKAAKLENSLFAPDLYEHYSKISQAMAKSSLIPKGYQNKPEDIFIAMAMGYQLGFPVEQSLQDIAVINGKPCVWGDGLLAIVMSHPQFEYIKEDFIIDAKGNIIGAQCIIKRKGMPERVVSFTLEDARKAGLLGKPGPWSQYTNRMMQMRARGFCARDTFPDALRGIKMAEEVKDYPEDNFIEGEKVDTAPKNNAPLSGTDRVKQFIKSKAKGLNNNDLSSENSSGSSSVSIAGDSNLNETAQAQQEEAKTSDIQPVAEDRTQNVESNPSEDRHPKASQKQCDDIKQLIKDKKIPQDEYMKIFNSYEVKSFSDLSSEQAEDFKFKLEMV